MAFSNNSSSATLSAKKPWAVNKVALPTILFSVFLLYMQYAKYRWKIISQPLVVDQIFTIFHVELSLFGAMALILLGIPFLKRYPFFF